MILGKTNLGPFYYHLLSLKVLSILIQFNSRVKTHNDPIQVPSQISSDKLKKHGFAFYLRAIYLTEWP